MHLSEEKFVLDQTFWPMSKSLIFIKICVTKMKAQATNLESEHSFFHYTALLLPSHHCVVPLLVY